MGLVSGAYDAKAAGFLPGGLPCIIVVGARPRPRDVRSCRRRGLEPQKIADTLAFMFETRLIVRPTRFRARHPGVAGGLRFCWAPASSGGSRSRLSSLPSS